MDFLTFNKLRDAANEMAKLRGWPQARVMKLTLDDGDYWVIECAPNRHLREDGFVR
jgi:hypothetical protein